MQTNQLSQIIIIVANHKAKKLAAGRSVEHLLNLRGGNGAILAEERSDDKQES